MVLHLMYPISNFICLRVEAFFLGCSTVSSPLRGGLDVPGTASPFSTIPGPVCLNAGLGNAFLVTFEREKI